MAEEAAFRTRASGGTEVEMRFVLPDLPEHATDSRELQESG